MSCCEGTRSLHKRYKISLTGCGKGIGTVPPTVRDVSPPALASSSSLLASSTTPAAYGALANDSSRVCGMAIADLTTRHSDSSSSSCSSSTRDSGFSISTTKSDPLLNRSSDSSSIISPARTRRRTTAMTSAVRTDTARRKIARVRWLSGHTGTGIGRLLVVFISSILLFVHGPLRAGAVLLDTNGGVGGPADGKAPVQAFGDELGGVNLERSIAAVFSRVAYGSTTTTKRSIPDNVYVPSLTTVSTPLLTTFRYDNKNKDALGGSNPGGGLGDKDSHYNQQQISANHRTTSWILSGIMCCQRRLRMRRSSRATVIRPTRTRTGTTTTTVIGTRTQHHTRMVTTRKRAFRLIRCSPETFRRIRRPRVHSLRLHCPATTRIRSRTNRRSEVRTVTVRSSIRAPTQTDGRFHRQA
uniref:Uncharacterized protein n=1 Tax=Anopheles funestus TaxID=62324 RepID=A0A4Y0B6T3_ANOFN